MRVAITDKLGTLLFLIDIIVLRNEQVDYKPVYIVVSVTSILCSCSVCIQSGQVITHMLQIKTEHDISIIIKKYKLLLSFDTNYTLATDLIKLYIYFF